MLRLKIGPFHHKHYTRKAILTYGQNFCWRKSQIKDLYWKGTIKDDPQNCSIRDSIILFCQSRKSFFFFRTWSCDNGYKIVMVMWLLLQALVCFTIFWWWHFQTPSHTITSLNPVFMWKNGVTSLITAKRQL